MSVSVTSRRLSDGHQPQPPLPHAVTPPSPDASTLSHAAFSSSSSHSASQQTSPQRRPSKPLEEHKQADPQLISRMSTSTVSASYSSSSISSSVQQHYQQHTVQDTSHHSVVSFAPLPAMAAVHSSSHHTSVHLPVDPHNSGNLTASTASHSSTNSYLPATRPPHPHSDTEDEGGEEDEEVEEGGEADEAEYDDDEESVDDSPRDGRILTFADEHGVQLCAFHVYDPSAVQNVTPRPEKQSSGGSIGSGGGESERRKETGKAVRVERTDAEANCQCCIS